MYLVVWEFVVSPGAESRFEAMYGPGGEWVSVFEKDEAWLGTELLKDAENARRYLTIDRWGSAEAYDRFLTRTRSEYERIDRAGEALTVTERLIGRFRC